MAILKRKVVQWIDKIPQKDQVGFTRVSAKFSSKRKSRKSNELSLRSVNSVCSIRKTFLKAPLSKSIVWCHWYDTKFSANKAAWT